MTSKTITNRYDAFGSRISRTADGIESRYVLDLTGSMERILCDMTSGGQITAYYIHGPDLCYKVDGAGNLTCYHPDAMANIIALTGTTGTNLALYAYTPYGRSLASTNSQPQISNPFLFVGSQGVMEEVPGLYFMRARYYSADAGVFLSTDPVKHIGPKWKPSEYRYADGNALTLLDPMGTEEWNPLQSAGGILGAPDDVVFGAATALGGEIMQVISLAESATGVGNPKLSWNQGLLYEAMGVDAVLKSGTDISGATYHGPKITGNVVSQHPEVAPYRNAAEKIILVTRVWYMVASAADAAKTVTDWGAAFHNSTASYYATKPDALFFLAEAALSYANEAVTDAPRYGSQLAKVIAGQPLSEDKASQQPSGSGGFKAGGGGGGGSAGGGGNYLLSYGAATSANICQCVAPKPTSNQKGSTTPNTSTKNNANNYLNYSPSWLKKK